MGFVSSAEPAWTALSEDEIALNLSQFLLVRAACAPGKKPVKAVSDRPPQPYQLAHQGTRALQSWTPISSANEARSVCDCAEMIYEQWHKVMQAICKHGDIVVSCYKSRPHAKIVTSLGPKRLIKEAMPRLPAVTSVPTVSLEKVPRNSGASKVQPQLRLVTRLFMLRWFR